MADADGTMDVDGVVEITLQTDDPEGLQRFYVRAFGMEVLSEERDRRWLKLGPRTRLGLWTPGVKEFGDQGGRHVHFAMSAAPDRLDAIRRRLTGEMGVEVEGPVTHDGGDRSIYLRDPAGNLIEVWDVLRRGEGARRGADALADPDAPDDPRRAEPGPADDGTPDPDDDRTTGPGPAGEDAADRPTPVAPSGPAAAHRQTPSAAEREAGRPGASPAGRSRA